MLRKEFEKLVDWMRGEPVPDIIELPNSLLIAMAAPLKQALNRPVCCTLQGEELFLNGLLPPYRDRALALIRRQVGTIDHFIAVSDYCASFMADLLGIPVVEDGRRPARCEPGRLSQKGRQAARRPASAGPSPSATSRGSLQRRDCTCSPTPTSASGAGQDTRRFGSKPPATWRRSSREYLDRVRQTLELAGLAGEFTYRGEIDRAGKLAFLAGLDVLSVPATYDEPKGLFLLEAMASGVPVVQPRRGGVHRDRREDRRRPARRARRSPTACRRSLRALERSRRDRHSSPTSAFDGVRAHYTIAQSADRLLEVYRRRSDAASARRWPVRTRAECRSVSKHYPTPRGPADRAVGRVAVDGARGRGRHHRSVRQREEHVAVYARRARATLGRDGDARRTESVRALGAGSWPTSATRRSGSSSRITVCCRSARCSRTC